MNAIPKISVVVPSHDRSLRLRWLLNALEDQTLDRGLWEVVVAHDSVDGETEDLLRTHPLADAGVLRALSLERTSASAAKLRNAGWRSARARAIAFTDDDCRPPPDWLEQALAAARAHPDAIVQGMTLSDPDEVANRHNPWFRSQGIVPPEPWAQTCNIIYPRDLLEGTGGFLEDPPVEMGEDTELALRAQQAGAAYVGERRVLTYHAVYPAWLVQHLRSLWRWRDVPLLVKRHPQLRERLPLWLFWKRTHVWLPLAVLGAARERRNPLWALLAVPYLVHATPRHGTNPRGRIRNLAELPGRMAIDATEMLALAWGSIKYRTFIL